MIVKILHKNKEEIKNQYMHQKGEDDSLYQLLMVCFKETTKFFETLKKQLKKAELQTNIGAEEVGHLIPLTVGHRDRPTNKETRYIETLMELSEFKYVPPTGIVMSEGLISGTQDPLGKITVNRVNSNSILHSPKNNKEPSKNNSNINAEGHNTTTNALNVSETPISRVPKQFLSKQVSQQRENVSNQDQKINELKGRKFGLTLLTTQDQVKLNKMKDQNKEELNKSNRSPKSHKSRKSDGKPKSTRNQNITNSKAIPSYKNFASDKEEE